MKTNLASLAMTMLATLAPIVLSEDSAYGVDSPALPVTIAPDNKQIRYVGRVDRTDPAAYRLGWAGVSFVFCYEGKTANLKFADECGGGAAKVGNMNNYVTIVIDGKPPIEMSLEKGRTLYRIGEGLEDGAHTVTVFKRNCPRINGFKFLGLQLEEGKGLKDPPPAKKRFIEVIGDSISVGYGVLGEKADSPALPIYENCYLTYGATAARELDADFACIAWSGMGVARDLRGNTENIMTNMYDLTSPHNKSLKWPFEEYTPDVVVINLGTNDFTAGVPTKEVWNKGYRALVEKVWSHAPKAHVFCVAGGMMGPNNVKLIGEYLQELFAEFEKEGKKNIHFLVFPHMDEFPNGRGSQWHPAAKVHRAQADLLIAGIKKELGW